jgi:hypothetical protein
MRLIIEGHTARLWRSKVHSPLVIDINNLSVRALRKGGSVTSSCIQGINRQVRRED